MTAAAVALACLAGVLALAGPADGKRQRPGIDVSNHQGRIAWSAVARSGERFVIAKASEGTTFIDSTYRRNRARARKHGLKVGAYHFARPDGGTLEARRADAREEARLYLAVARLRPGHLLPVLDLEVSGGLEVRALRQWTRAWLRTVRRLLGVRGMIYTSPHFWRTAMGDTRWFANHGYRSLWIAHWQTSAPDVPAGNWGGEGWTFWQWTSCGRVPGVSGCVDRNHYRGARWRPVLIPRPGRRGRPPDPVPGPLPLPDLPELPDLPGLSLR